MVQVNFKVFYLFSKILVLFLIEILFLLMYMMWLQVSNLIIALINVLWSLSILSFLLALLNRYDFRYNKHVLKEIWGSRICPVEDWENKRHTSLCTDQAFSTDKFNVGCFFLLLMRFLVIWSSLEVQGSFSPYTLWTFQIIRSLILTIFRLLL